MRKKSYLLAGILSIAVMLTACGKDPKLEQFKNDIDTFCTNISVLDTSINNVDVGSDNALEELLGYLEELDSEFQTFAALDFPEEFDYLEPYADEAGAYMAEAVSSYRDAYTNEAYTEEMFTATYEYARENEARAFRRIQIIITLLHGEDPATLGLTATESENTADQ